MKNQPASQPASVPNSLHRSRKKRSMQKGTAYKVPAAEAAGQKVKSILERFQLLFFHWISTSKLAELAEWGMIGRRWLTRLAEYWWRMGREESCRESMMESHQICFWTSRISKNQITINYYTLSGANSRGIDILQKDKGRPRLSQRRQRRLRVPAWAWLQVLSWPVSQEISQGELYDPDDSASIPGTGSSGRSCSTNESMAQEKTSFMFSAKWRYGKPLNPEKKFLTHLSNDRFDCLEEVSSAENS